MIKLEIVHHEFSARKGSKFSAFRMHAVQKILNVIIHKISALYAEFVYAIFGLLDFVQK